MMHIAAREGNRSLYPKDKAPDAKVTARTNKLNNTHFILTNTLSF